MVSQETKNPCALRLFAEDDFVDDFVAYFFILDIEFLKPEKAAQASIQMVLEDIYTR